MLGFLWADGHYRLDRNTLTLMLESQDRFPVSLLQEIMSTGNMVATRARVGKKSLTYTLRIGGLIHAGSRLSDLGMQLGGKQALCPPNIPRRLFRSFVRGFFDGDGCVFVHNYTSGRASHLETEFAGTPQIVTWVRDILADEGITGSLGMRPSIVGGPPNGQLRFKKEGSRQLYHFMYYPGCTCLERKRRIFEKFVQPASKIRQIHICSEPPKSERCSTSGPACP